MKRNNIFLILILVGIVFSCQKEATIVQYEPHLVFRLQLDEFQERLDAFGEPSTVPENHSAQHPLFHGLGIHYIEFSPTELTPIGGGNIVYNSPRSEDRGIVFDQLNIVNSGEKIVSIPLSSVEPGTFEFARVSVAYQNYAINFRANGMNFTGRLASFVGDTNSIETFQIKNETVAINGLKYQGYWAFEVPAVGDYYDGDVLQGQAPGTTVPNPIHATSPIPAGGCILTGKFTNKLEITGKETEDIIIDLSFSINNSFEWIDQNQNGIFEPLDGDEVVDMGLRGLIPKRVN